MASARTLSTEALASENPLSLLAVVKYEQSIEIPLLNVKTMNQHQGHALDRGMVEALVSHREGPFNI